MVILCNYHSSEGSSINYQKYTRSIPIIQSEQDWISKQNFIETFQSGTVMAQQLLSCIAHSSLLLHHLLLSMASSPSLLVLSVVLFPAVITSTRLFSLSIFSILAKEASNRLPLRIVTSISAIQARMLRQSNDGVILSQFLETFCL